MALYFSNSFSSSIRNNVNLLFLSLSPSLTLNILTYPLIIGIIKANGLITLSKYPMKYILSLFRTDLMGIITLRKVNLLFIGKES